ncbi:MAG TPA: IscS subfamily cysteine desulfurase [Bacteroidia bacterium]|nr:IscS subfamily cysteine desulfurase [Bacteroidia bacterium]
MLKIPVYLDYNSTTPVDSLVLEKMIPYFSERFGNAASRTHSFGWIAEEAVDHAREQTARLINSEPGEIIFTSGSTEAINLALKGIFENYSSKGNHIITVRTEHKAVLDTCSCLEAKGAQITYLDVDRSGMIDLNHLSNSINESTILVSVMFANNETGVIQPIAETGRICKEKKVLFFCDATQAIGKTRVDVNEYQIDMLSISAHKFYGPKGTGALYIRRKNPRVKPAALIHGGGHEKEFRSGTLNVPGIVGFGEACEIAAKRMWEDNERISKLRTLLEQSLTKDGDAFINGSIKNRLPNTTNIAFKGINSGTFIKEIPDIAVATGSACTSAIPEPSHVLRAMGLSDEEANSSIRFSLGRFTSEEEIKFAIEKIKKISHELH